MSAALRLAAALLLAALPAAAQRARVVSLAPAVTETIFAVGGEQCLVGRSSACTHPAAAEKLPSAGGYSTPSLERILELRPTHVLISYLADPGVSNRLAEAGVEVRAFACDRADGFAAMRRDVAAICGRRGKRALALVQREPPVAAGSGTLAADVLSAAGYENALADQRGYFTIGAERRLTCGAEVEIDFSREFELMRLGPQFHAALEEFCRRTGSAAWTHAAPGADVAAARDVTRALWRLRARRIWAGCLAGFALAMAGAALQTVLRNPLADPFVLGVSGGASLAAALALVTGLAAAVPHSLPAAAFVGAAAALALVMAAARAAGGGPVAYALSGVVAGSVSSAALMALLTAAPERTLQSVTWWMMGSLDSADAPRLVVATAIAAAAAFVLAALSRKLNAMALGPELADSLGAAVSRTTAVALVAAAALTAAAVMTAGIIGFVGLIVPHAARRIVGANHRLWLPASGAAGAAFLVACDWLGRQCAAAELPPGVVTALAGGPFFLWLLARRRDA